MKVYKGNDTEWHLADEDLIPIIADISGKDEVKRGYTTFPYKGGKVFIKSFIEKGIAGFVRNRVLPRGKKEYLLGVKLSSFSIPTPMPLGYGVSPMGSYIIQEWVEGNSLSYALKEEKGKREALIDRLAVLLKALKTYHVRHNDLHLDNILVAHESLYLIDLHKMEIKKFFRMDDEVSNLSHALVSLYNDMTETEKDAFFSVYGSEDVRRPVEREIVKLTLRWFRKKMERAFEGTSRIRAVGSRLSVIGTEDCAAGPFLESIKQDKKVRVERYSDHIRKIYRDARRLKKAWKAHVVFLYMDLPVVPRAFYLQWPSTGQEGYIAMEDLKDRGVELDRYLDGRYDTMDYGERKAFIDGLSRFFDTLLKWGIMHKDLKGCNIFVSDEKTFTLLDVEDIVFNPLDSESIKRMFLQLNTTLPKRIVMRDRMRFFIRLTSVLTIDRNALFRKLLWESAKREIVYEGKSGLMRESW
ncbi:MAG: hypothetical protein C0392_03625 [Syntrophus sp. (in: bacteria)]|nr:hypothetical protein [Syntrophus sp. (in: bacteria)]